MGEARQFVAFRYAMQDLVYLAGSPKPYEVLGQMYITMTLSGEERRYYLKSSLGDTCWIDERHVYAAPTRQAPDRDAFVANVLSAFRDDPGAVHE